MRHIVRTASLAIAVWLACVAPASAQYFGRNKVQYRTFSFRVLKTEHFDIYYYVEEADAAQVIGRMSERWYSRLSRFFDHELRGRQTVILYASGAHFRQTNAIEGLIGEGTGGVTEAVKRRVVVPMAGSLADTDHVLGHELVHAFQFDMTGATPQATNGLGPAILSFPLWFVEGMAEYVSLGPVDPQTAMWLRDAVISNRVPDIRSLDNPKYFPYRWGQAFWAYIGARYGDREVASLLRSAVNPRLELGGLAVQLGTTPQALNDDWHQAIRDAAMAVDLSQPAAHSDVHRLISQTSSGGLINVGPRLSPDGKKIAFFSERDLFSIDLFVADVATGRIEHRLVHAATDQHFDSLQFLYSAGAWSPDGRSIALAAIRSGAPTLALVDVDSGSVTREIALPGLADALGPAWSPDGREIVLSGNRGGFSDLFRVTLATGEIDPLTSDAFADLEPAFTPDGKSIIFATDRFSTNLETLTPGPLRLARLDLATGDVQPIAGFLTGKHLSPQVSADGATLTFIGEPDGVSNIYRMPIDGGPIMQISAVDTGVAGITPTSPALTMASGTGAMAFSVFEQGGNAIYTLAPHDIVATVPPDVSARAALLPSRTAPGGVVYGLLGDYTGGLPAADSPAKSQVYRSHLALEAVGQPTFGAAVSSWGPQFSGGVSAVFSDMLGDRTLGMGASVNGRLADLGGVIEYLNRKHRVNWGAEIDQTPQAIGFLTDTADPATNTFSQTLTIDRQVARGGAGVAIFPLNESARIEASAGLRHYSFSEEDRSAAVTLDTGAFISESDQTHSLGRSLNLAETTLAFVHDTSFFGATSPIYGQRYRFEADKTTGTLHYISALADVRQYFMPKRPVTVALRVLHYGRYGPGSEDPELLSPVYWAIPSSCTDTGTALSAPQSAALDRSVSSQSSMAVECS